MSNAQVEELISVEGQQAAYGDAGRNLIVTDTGDYGKNGSVSIENFNGLPSREAIATITFNATPNEINNILGAVVGHVLTPDGKPLGTLDLEGEEVVLLQDGTALWKVHAYATAFQAGSDPIAFNVSISSTLPE